jgi:hypothetical protein
MCPADPRGDDVHARPGVVHKVRVHENNDRLENDQGLPDFSWYNIPKRENTPNIPNDHKNRPNVHLIYQMTIKIYQMAVK